MKWTSVNDIREKYLSFFESKGHLRHKSFPLVPINDKSILLINAGMTPLKKYFTGEEEPPRHRMTTCQKCIRTPDIDRVGITARHGTYFEMLGNFSFGDYFKKEVIPWAWEFCTKVIELPEERIWVTVYLEDDEAYDIWTKEVGIPEERVVRLGKEDNFWEHGSGPCGPCSELHFDRGEEFGCGKPDCKPGCDCDRYMEFWNLVFTQFDNDGNNNYTRLAKPNIDTGMGLERLACIMQGVNNLFEVDTVQNIMKAIVDKAGVKYGDDPKKDISLRVITDHVRGSTFMICDGVSPSNEGRGYVLRRLLRRAARHGRMLGIKGNFLADIAAVVARENYSEYPELTEKLEYISKVISIEESRFASTIDSGLAILSGVIEKVKADGGDKLPGEDVFRLYDTFGFPIDLTREIAAEAGLAIDEETFLVLMKEQKTRAKEARANISGWSEASKGLLESFTATEFVGYTENACEAKVIGIISDDMQLETVNEGEFSLILDKTVFYGEGGGQVGDSGKITLGDTVINVYDTKKTNGVYIHMASIVSGTLSVGDTVKAEIDLTRREAIRRNHSACHLLQAALREVLGAHVEQAGSYVDDHRLRFDFSHYEAVNAQQIAKVEALVNAHILAGEAVETVETDIESAKKAGAMALFGEKYGATVRMVKMGDFSTELCGGTHITNTAKAGLFKVISESSVAAGVRRIEATTGLGVLELLSGKDDLITETAKEMKLANTADLAKRASQLQSELKGAKSEIEALESKIASYEFGETEKSAIDVNGISVIASRLDGVSVDSARNLCDGVREKNPASITLLALVANDRLNFVCVCGADAVKRGANAGKIVKEIATICGGGGGGRPDSATAGAKDLSKIADALAAVTATVEKYIK
ncbi:MAG: alanine--tRNA ligase [Clostridia bacterium]|nr:alanine--tRNA ligase [Clostridia bacterium]